MSTSIKRVRWNSRASLLALLVILSVILTACGGDATATTAPSGSATDTPGSGGSGSTGEQIVLTQWYHQYGEEGTQQAAQRYADEYSKINPNVKINMVWKPGDYGTELNAALLGSDAPDVYEQSALTPDMVKSKQVVALDDIYGDTLSDFNKVGLVANTYQGKIYGVKMINDMGMIYYRKSLLTAAGVQPPTTLEELGAAIDKLTSGQVKGIFLGNDGGVGVLQSELLWSSGHDYLKDGKPDFNNDDVVSAFTMGQKFLKDHSAGILNGSPTDWWDPTAFTSGLVAMQWTGLWAMPGIQKAIGDDFGVIAWPQIAAGKGTNSTFWGGWSEYVNGNGKHIDEAKKFVQWLWIQNTADQADWSTSYGFHVPPRNSAATAATKLQSGPAKEAVDILNKFGVPNNPLWSNAMGTAYGDATVNILTKGADAKTELAKAETTVNAELAKQ